MNGIMFSVDNFDSQYDEIQAYDLDAKRFRKAYWSTNTPILIKGAVRHWPAFSNWKDPEYLIKKIGSVPVEVRYEPLNESVHNNLTEANMLFDNFYENVNHNNKSSLWIHAQNIVIESSRAIEKANASMLSEFSKKLSGLAQEEFSLFPFLGDVKESIIYPTWRVFLYKNSFTDWHAHPIDSHLMCQIVGKKEVFLFPPNKGYELIQSSILDAGIRSCEASVAIKEKIREARPIRVVVEDGDALHIPVHWYHMVQPLEDSPSGITVAYAFRSPMRIIGDQRFKFNKRLFGRTPRHLKPIVIYAQFLALIERYKPLYIA
jgi:hypothetical protein